MIYAFSDGSYSWMQPSKTSVVQHMCKSEMKKIPEGLFKHLSGVWVCRKFDESGFSIGWVFGFSLFDEGDSKELDVIAKTVRDYTRVFKTLDAAVDYVDSLGMFENVRVDFG